MLEFDIKMFSVVGIIILLIVGYFVYSMFQDLTILKNEITELKSEKPEEFQDDNESLVCEHDDNESEDNYDHESEDLELERHLKNFMEEQASEYNKNNGYVFEPVIEPVASDVIQEVADVVEIEPEVELTVKQVKQVKPKRVYKKKSVHFIEEPVVESSEQTEVIEN